MNMEPLPEWLMATAEAAGRTAFTDEFDFGGNERSPLNIAMLSDLLEQQDHETNDWFDEPVGIE